MEDPTPAQYKKDAKGISHYIQPCGPSEVYNAQIFWNAIEGAFKQGSGKVSICYLSVALENHKNGSEHYTLGCGQKVFD